MSQDITMLQALLTRLMAEGKIDVAQAAQATGIDPSTIYKWASQPGRDPGFTSIYRLFRASSPDVQHALLDLLTAGTPWQALYQPTADDLDVDGDGRVSGSDAVAAASAALQALATQLNDVNEALRDRDITEQEELAVREAGQACIRWVLQVSAALTHCRQQQVKRTAGRRHAHPLPACAG